MDITSEFAIEGIRQADRIIEELESCMRDVRKKPSEMKGIFLDADDAQQILDILPDECFEFEGMPENWRADE